MISQNQLGSSNKWLASLGIEVVDEAEIARDTRPRTEFQDLLENSETSGVKFAEGEVVDGVIVNIGDEFVTVDIGYKSEGLVPIHEFRGANNEIKAQPGDVIAVYLEHVETDSGTLVLSKDKADIIRAWDEISQACERDEVVEGTVISKVKGGLNVDIGVKAFLPGSQIDIRPIRNLDKFIGKRMSFKVIKFNKKRGNIVLSRKAIMMKERDELRRSMLENLAEGQVVTGSIKNITEYGAFVDIGGLDGLLHITDMSWGRIKHPSELFQVGDEIQCMVLKYDREKERISLGYKQAQPNPWDEIAHKYEIGQRVKGKIISLKDYGAFVDLGEGIEGLIHVSEMSWTQKVKHPSKIVNIGDEVEAVVLDIDPKNKRISMGLKQLEINPWSLLSDKYPVGTNVEGTIKSIMDFGAFVDIGEGIDGLIHISDISWTKRPNHPSEVFQEGAKVKAVVLAVDKEAEKFSLGIKQLAGDPWDRVRGTFRVGARIKGKVTRLTEYGAFVDIMDGMEGLIHISEMAEERVDRPNEMLQPGQEIDVEVISLDNKERKIGLSIKALKRSEEREAMQSYTDSADKSKAGTTNLGDLLSQKLKK